MDSMVHLNIKRQTVKYSYCSIHVSKKTTLSRQGKCQTTGISSSSRSFIITRVHVGCKTCASKNCFANRDRSRNQTKHMSCTVPASAHKERSQVIPVCRHLHVLASLLSWACQIMGFLPFFFFFLQEISYLTAGCWNPTQFARFPACMHPCYENIIQISKTDHVLEV